MKRGNSADVREIRMKAIAFIKENDKKLSREEISTELVERFGYAERTALGLISQAKKGGASIQQKYWRRLMKFLQKLEEKEQKAREKKC